MKAGRVGERFANVSLPAVTFLIGMRLLLHLRTHPGSGKSAPALPDAAKLRCAFPRASAEASSYRSSTSPQQRTSPKGGANFRVNQGRPGTCDGGINCWSVLAGQQATHAGRLAASRD